MAKESKIALREIIFVILLAAVALSLRVPYMSDPLDRDEGVIAYTAAASYRAELPYRDVFDRNPPMIFYIYKSAFDAFGVKANSIRYFTAAFIIFTMLLIYMLARSVSGAFTAMAASLLYAVFMCGSYQQAFGSGSGVFTGFTAVFAIFFLLDRDKTYEKANFFLAGFLMAAAFLTKALMLAAALAVVIYILFFMKEKKSLKKGLIWYAGGFFSLAALAVLWSLKNNMLKEFLEGLGSYNIVFAGMSAKHTDFSRVLSAFFDFAKTHALLASAYAYSFAALFVNKENKLNTAAFLCSTLILAAALLIKSYSPQNFAAALPFLCLQAALMIYDAAGAAYKITGRKTAAAAVVVLLLAGGIAWNFYSGVFVPWKIKPGADAVPYEARKIAQEIINEKNENTSLFVWPNDAEIYFYTGIKSRTRFINSYPYGYYGTELSTVMTGLLYNPPDFLVLQKGVNDNLFENLVKTYYSKFAEGSRLVLYKKGGLHEKSK